MVTTAQAVEENNNSPFSAFKNRAIPTYPMMNTRRKVSVCPLLCKPERAKKHKPSEEAFSVEQVF